MTVLILLQPQAYAQTQSLRLQRRLQAVAAALGLTTANTGLATP